MDTPSDTDANLDHDAVEQPPPFRPYWIPDGVEYDTLPAGLQAAIRGILTPVFIKLVFEPVDELEWSTGLTIVHLLWLEILEQFELGELWAEADQDEQSQQKREATLSRLLRLVGAKHKVSTFLMRIVQHNQKYGGFPHAADPLIEEIARARARAFGSGSSDSAESGKNEKC